MKIILIFAIFLNQNVNCDRKGFFTVVGSNVIKVNKPYRVSVTYQGYLEEQVLQIGIEKYHEDDQSAVLQNVTLIGDGVQDIDFNVSITDKFSQNSDCVNKRHAELYSYGCALEIL